MKMYFTANGWQESIKAQKEALYSWKAKEVKDKQNRQDKFEGWEWKVTFQGSGILIPEQLLLNRTEQNRNILY